MKIIQNFDQENPKSALVVTLGMFDGVHRGHLSIIQKLKKIADEKELQTGILSFWPHPRKFLNPEINLHLLTTLDEKVELLDKSGIDFLFLKKFDEEFRNLSAEEFVKKILVEELNTKYIIIGHDHTFGKNKSGDYHFLKEVSAKYGFEVEQLPAITNENINISSTKIRYLLQEGNIESANQMLGYHYSITGKVIKGNQLGRQLGFPTANIETDEDKLLPKHASYIVKININNNTYYGMLNIGLRPTVDGKKVQTEVNIFDFNQDIYGKYITIEFLSFLRDEKKFGSLDDLIAQLKEDEINSRKYISSQFS